MFFNVFLKIMIMKEQSTLKKYGFDVTAYAEIKNMNEIQFKEYCR